MVDFLVLALFHEVQELDVCLEPEIPHESVYLPVAVLGMAVPCSFDFQVAQQ
jgi:hypothetical protein